MTGLAEYPFVQIYMVASTVAFLWFGAAFPVGAFKGSRAGALVLVAGLWAYLAALAGTTVWAVASGEWARFSAGMGMSVLFEMAVLVGLWQFIMYFMASRYLSDKRRKEAASA